MGTAGGHRWKDEEVEHLTKLWNDGLSARQIAERVSARIGATISRNAVIGVLHRKGLQRGNVVRPRQQPTRQRRRPRPQEQPTRPLGPMARLRASLLGQPVAEPLPAEEQPTGPLVALLDLEAWSCRWPIGDPKLPGFGFCGARKFAGLAYCERHALRAYQEGSSFQARRHRKLLEDREDATAPLTQAKETVGP